MSSDSVRPDIGAKNQADFKVALPPGELLPEHYLDRKLSIKSGRRVLLLGLLSGTALTLCFNVPGLSWLAFIALVPWVVAITACSSTAWAMSGSFLLGLVPLLLARIATSLTFQFGWSDYTTHLDQLFHRGRPPAARHRLLFALAGAGIGSGALTPYRQSTPMALTPIGTDLN